MAPKEVFSPHAFRVYADQEGEPLPVFAPEGRLFYLVTPSPHAPAKERRYLHSVKTTAGKPATVVLTHSRTVAKAFNNLRLAESLAEFLADPRSIIHEHDFWITLEPPGYREEKTTAKRGFQSLAEAR